MSDKTRSIRFQLLLMTVIVLIAVSALAVWTANLYAERSARLSYDRLLHGAALQIAENINLLNGNIIIDLPVSAFETLALSPSDRAYYAVTDTSFHTLTGYSDLPQGLHALYHLEKDTLDAQQPLYTNEQYRGESVRFILLKKRLIEADTQQDILIILGQTTLSRQQLADEMSRLVIKFVLAFFIITLAILMFGIWKVLRPLRLLQRDISQKNASELAPLSTHVPSEIRPLIHTINYFMEQLNATLERLKRFTSEAAHQLRTPLAGLNLQAQNALDEQDENQRRKQLLDIVNNSSLLAETVNHILNEATLAHRLRSQSFTPVSLDKISREVCISLVAWALDQQVDIEYIGKSSSNILGDEFALTQMLRNIVENAVNYSPPYHCVQVTLNEEDRRIRLTVSDQGMGISDEDKKHVFERFYRSEHSMIQGTGLGLAIAKEVAEHHKATFRLLDNDPQGLIVELLFPLQGH